MEKVRELLKNPLYVGIAAGVLGLLIGWIVIGWLLWPVTYYDASPSNMRADLQVDYLRMAIDSYSKNPDQALAKRRYQDLGSNATSVLDEIRKAPGKTFPDDIIKFSNALSMPAGQVVPTVQATSAPATPAAGQPTAVPQATKAPVAGQPTAVPTSAAAQPTKAPVVAQPTSVPTSAAGTSENNSGTTLLVVLCLVLLVIGGALAYVFLMRNRKGGDFRQVFAGLGGKKQTTAPQADYQAAPGVETPIAQFMTTYKLGVDLYDDSFSIDSPTGEFLGECGVGISKPIGVGDPKKVTAFEVWLFDKNDIQTVTKVLMSENAFNDPATLQELQAKGEPVLVTPGAEIYLQTATLQLTARVVDTSYGQGALAPNSFFDRLTLELAIWPKPAQ